MSARSIGLWAVIGLLLGVAGLRGDEVLPPPGAAAPVAPQAAPPTELPPPPGDPPVAVMPGPPPVRQLSAWITGGRPDCCGPMGKHGPIDMELYVRNGVSFPIAGAIFNDTLDPGYVLQGGWRTLLFDPTDAGAWFVDLSISSVWNSGRHSDRVIPLRDVLVPVGASGNQANFGQEVSVPLVGVTIRALHRTFVNVGLGREWYLLGTGHGPGPKWRAGFDGGGRYGSSSLRTFELPHRTDVIGGAWAAVHSDVEMPYGAFTFQGGLRLEWDYTWSDILQRQNNSDMQDLNLMINLGVRF